MNHPSSRAWLITNHSPRQIVTGYSSIQPTDLIIAVDGGYSRCLELHLIPNILMGDFDSIDLELMDNLPSTCKKLTFPADKDETDTQLALEYCIANNIEEVFICNDLMGRADHAWALIQNLQQAKKSQVKASILSNTQILTILDVHNKFTYPADSIISLLSLSESSVFASSNGLKYPLDNLTLYSWQSKGISNEAIANEQEIQLCEGNVMMIVTVV